MSRPTSQQYAELASDAYRNPSPGEKVIVDGVTFEVREHVNHSGRGESGYAGTIYQRTDTGEMVVAHRGTEFQANRNGIQDLLLTDGSMVVNRQTNGQGDEAVALTRRAIELAGGDTSKVTVTGHSLGGTLAQISAAETGVRGETFNAYGAVGLERRGIREGGSSVVNHVMAGDAVSSANDHFGTVRTYATTEEIDRMKHPLFGGYSNNRIADAAMPDHPFIVAGRSAGSHSMHNFLNVDGDGQRDRSVIGDTRAIERAAENARMIRHYRDDIQDAHTVVRAGGDASRYIRDLREIGRDIFGAVEPPANNGPATRMAAVDGNGTSNLLDRMLSDDRSALHAAANLPAGKELNQNVVALVDREQLQTAERLAEQQRVIEPDPVRSAGGRSV